MGNDAPAAGPSETAEPAKVEPAEGQDMRGELDAAQREVDALITRLKYLQADFDNFRKRSAKEAETLVRYAYEGLLSRLLPALDEIDAAVASASGPAGQGLAMVRDNLLKALQEVGLQEIPARGLPFDPYVHECLEQAPAPDVPDGTVTSVVRKGYRLHDRVLRPAHVIVAKNGGDSDAENHRN